MKIHFMYADDWVGLYLDEALVREGHNLDPEELLALLGIEYTEEWVDDLEKSGNRCPKVRERQLILDGFEGKADE